MEQYKNITLDQIRAAVGDLFYPEERNITLHTGTGGMELHTESMEKIGTRTTRVYVGRKPMRLLKRSGRLVKSEYSGRWFYRIKAGQL